MLAASDFASSIAIAVLLLVSGVVGGFWYCRKSK
jgi:uncharacterized protein YneF (UPF0154 family)